jgi:hypothetical protein
MEIDVAICNKAQEINIPFIAIECKSLLKLDYFREIGQ